jgi:ABC-type sugar transport system ATPase subunit
MGESSNVGAAAPGAALPPLLEVRDVTKRFGPVVAVAGVALELRRGEITALLGENGAGKSTLIQILAGVHTRYGGELLLDGEPFAPANAAEAAAAGIVLIAQETSIVPQMTIAENMFLNAEPARLGWIDKHAMAAGAREALRLFDLGEVDVTRPMADLDLATQQLAVIASALSRNTRLLILDEPTAALSENEVERLFGHLRRLRERGISILFVSHRLAEVFAIADRIVVMRDARIQGDFVTQAVTRDLVVREMIGSEVDLVRSDRGGRPATEPVLDVRELSAWDPVAPDRVRVDGISFTLHRGEILGLFGLVGSGCSVAVQALFGAWEGKVRSVTILNGVPVALTAPAQAIRNGIALMAADRRATLIHEHPVADNIVLASLEKVSRRGVLDLAAKHVRAGRFVEQLQIRTRSSAAPVGSLSGGNQQKVQIARWLSAEADVLLLDDPTRGVDIGARAEINRLWLELAASGRSIVMVSSDAEELVDLCDRVLVLKGGRIVAEHPGETVTEAQLLHDAAGV